MTGRFYLTFGDDATSKKKHGLLMHWETAPIGISQKVTGAWQEIFDTYRPLDLFRMARVAKVNLDVGIHDWPDPHITLEDAWDAARRSAGPIAVQ